MSEDKRLHSEQDERRRQAYNFVLQPGVRAGSSGSTSCSVSVACTQWLGAWLGVHSRARFQDYDASATELSERDARLIVANEEGYAFWAKYESYLNLDPTVQQVIAAARYGEPTTLQGLLRADPGAANPRWVRGRRPARIPNDSIPLNCLAEGVFNGTNKRATTISWREL